MDTNIDYGRPAKGMQEIQNGIRAVAPCGAAPTTKSP